MPPPGDHGGDGLRVARALGIDAATVLDLSQSLNPFAPDVVALAAEHLGSLRRYPDATDATHALAAALEVDPAGVLLTNGGAEAIALVAAELGGRVRSEPEFALHPRQPDGPVWRSNPHNPTGRLAASDDHANVWDEAFYPLATGEWSRRDPDSIVVGSLTKVFACPGLRIGYVLGPPDLIGRLRTLQPAWSLNGLAATLLPKLLAAADLRHWARAIATQRAALVDLLERHGLTPESSDANWLLAKAPGLRARLAPHGIVVRDCASFGLPDHVRIAVPDDDGLRRLEEALCLTS